MDVLAGVPVPSTSVDICMSNGFQLNSGVKILDGNGVLLVGGEAFAWRPWGPNRRLVNEKGQWQVDGTAFGLLGLVWPRPGQHDFFSSLSFSPAMGSPVTNRLAAHRSLDTRTWPRAPTA